MNYKDNPNDIKKMLNDYFKNDINKEIPTSTEKAINKAFARINAVNKMRRIKRVVALIICTITITSGVVFAKEIVNFLNYIFNNSTNSINTAANNNYIQNIEMDFVYNNDIGIKVDKVLFDNSSMNISYDYKINSEYNIDNIELYDYQIKDERDNLLYSAIYDNNSYDKPFIIDRIQKDNKVVKIRDDIFNNSIIYFSDNLLYSKDIVIEVASIKINNENIISGEWKLKIELDKKFNQNKVIDYELKYNEHIIKNDMYLTETTLKIFMEIDTKYDDKVKLTHTPVLKDSFENIYTCREYITKNMENTALYNLEFDVSKYDKNIDNLILILPINETTTLELELTKRDIRKESDY